MCVWLHSRVYNVWPVCRLQVWQLILPMPTSLHRTFTLHFRSVFFRLNNMHVHICSIYTWEETATTPTLHCEWSCTQVVCTKATASISDRLVYKLNYIQGHVGKSKSDQCRASHCINDAAGKPSCSHQTLPASGLQARTLKTRWNSIRVYSLWSERKHIKAQHVKQNASSFYRLK